MNEAPIQTRVEVRKMETGYAIQFDWERGNELELIHALEAAVLSYTLFAVLLHCLEGMSV